MLEALYRHISLQSLIWLIAALPLAGALINALVAIATARSEGPKLRALVALAGCALPAAAFAAAAAVFATLLGFDVVSPSAITGPIFRWALLPDLVIDVGLRADQLSLVMALTVTGVGSLIHLYSVGAMWHDEGFARYFALLNLFLFFMLVLVLADNLVLLFAGWEGVGLCSWLLISYWFDDAAKAAAGTKAMIVNAIGDAGLLLGMFLVFGAMAAAGATPESGAFNFGTMQQFSAYSLPVATAASFCFLWGAIGKSAQLPLHVWLPDAMAGPTPVSALIHAATMVAAGVYLIVRLNFLFVLAPAVLEVMAVVGAVTALAAALMGLAETDLKRILAYSTISQLGFMFLACGIGAFAASIFHLVSHALFKALLFLAAGSAIAALGGEQDIRRMGGLARRMPISAWSFVIAAAALAGLAPTVGFFSKDAILWEAFERGHPVLWTCGFVGAGLTALYIFRAAGSVFFGAPEMPPERFKHAAEPPVSMVVPIMLLATLVLVGGMLGVPESLGGANRLIAWLSALIPVELSRAPSASSHGTEIVLMAVTLVWCAHFSILGWLVYAQKRDLPRRMARHFRPLAVLVERHFFVDELYDLAIVRPLAWFSRTALWRGFDLLIVDRMGVEGTGRGVEFLGTLARAAQTGVLQHYVLYLLLGAVAVVGMLAL